MPLFLQFRRKFIQSSDKLVHYSVAMANILLGAGILVLATGYVYLLASVSASLPSVQQSAAEFNGSNNFTIAQTELKFPRSLSDLTALAKLLAFYKENYFSYVLLLFCSAYLYKQCFAIPGSVFMNLLAGALFGLPCGFPLCCFLTACGASGCYLLSKHFGQQLVEKLLHARLVPLRRKVGEHRDSMFVFLLFLRLFPMSPNWFLNIASPLVNVPLVQFFPSVLIGLMPYNFITVEAGVMLSSLTSVQDMFSTGTLAKLAGVSGLALAFVLAKNRFKSAIASKIDFDKAV